MIDTDGSGCIEQGELKALLDVLVYPDGDGEVSKEEVESVLEEVDVNHDGQVSITKVPGPSHDLCRIVAGDLNHGLNGGANVNFSLARYNQHPTMLQLGDFSQIKQKRLPIVEP